MKKPSLVYILICLLAASSGFIFDIREFGYELKNGPPLVTTGFIRKIANLSPEKREKLRILGIDKSNTSNPGIVLRKTPLAPLPDIGVGIVLGSESKSKGKFMVIGHWFFNKANAASKAEVKELHERFQEIGMWSASKREINRYIDSRIFSDTTKRVEKKREIVKVLDKLVSSTSEK